MDDGEVISFVRVLLIVIFMPSELGFTMYSLLFFTDVIDIDVAFDKFIDGVLLGVILSLLTVL